MAEDLCRKSAIIETYVMDSRIGQCPLPSPHPSSSPSPTPFFPTVQSCGFSPLLTELTKFTAETTGARGKSQAGQDLCVFLCIPSLVSAPPSCLSLCRLSTLLSLVSLCHSHCPFSSLCLFLCFLSLLFFLPHPPFILSHCSYCLSKWFHLWKFSFSGCISLLGSFSPLFLPSPPFSSSFLHPPFLFLLFPSFKSSPLPVFSLLIRIIPVDAC